MISFANGQAMVSVHLGVSREKAWEIVTDTHLWPRWGPSLTAVQCSDRFIHRNSYGRVKTIFGLWLPFTITEFENLSFWSWRIGRITATGHRITAQGDGCCELTFTMPWWASPYLVVCALALRRIERIAGQRSQSSDQ
ncbi:SRPBCC family protein [Desulfogranum marinum]|jgi:hypothetical protein|uniref:SRPBCC family protein n=1 Tax=Desulfogranum marinum TaxID=453220 RepID=UPI0019640C9B|nr:SRPBCC family protein [Desulfogranum marinum]MBM9514164.1 SRPBCC family protein [Desulfogranum marinum]